MRSTFAEWNTFGSMYSFNSSSQREKTFLYHCLYHNFLLFVSFCWNIFSWRNPGFNSGKYHHWLSRFSFWKRKKCRCCTQWPGSSWKNSKRRQRNFGFFELVLLLVHCFGVASGIFLAYALPNRENVWRKSRQWRSTHQKSISRCIRSFWRFGETRWF